MSEDSSQRIQRALGLGLVAVVSVILPVGLAGWIQGIRSGDIGTVAFAVLLVLVQIRILGYGIEKSKVKADD